MTDYPRYPFIDLAVHPAIRDRFAAGDAVAVASPELDQVLWANGAAAHLFGYQSIYEFIEEGIAGQSAIRRQVAAAVTGLAHKGAQDFMIRTASGFRKTIVPARVELVELPGGAPAVLILAESAAGLRGETVRARQIISGFEGTDTHVAVLDATGTVLAASPSFEEIAASPADCARMVADVAHEDDRLVKRMMETARGAMPAAIGRLTDAPALHLLFAVEPATTQDAGAAAPADRPTMPLEAAEAPGTGPAVPLQAPPDFQAARDIGADVPGRQSPLHGGDAEPEALWDAVPPQDLVRSLGEREGAALQSGQDAAAPLTEESHEIDRAAGKGEEEASGPVETGESPASPPEPGGKGDSAFSFDPSMRPVRFVWKIDREGHFSEVSPEFAAAVGPNAADIVGRKFADIARVFNLDPDHVIADLLSRRDTWSGKTVYWPIQGTDLVAPVDLAALPTYTRERQFDGFRGFGIVRVTDATTDSEALGLALVPGPRPQSVSDAPVPGFPQGAPEAAGAAASEAETVADTHPADEETAADADTGVSRPDGPQETVPASSEMVGQSETAQDRDPFRGEAPALRMTPHPVRREADKVIDLHERRGRGREGLSPLEQAAFREIGARLGATVGRGDTADTKEAEQDRPAATEEGARLDAARPAEEAVSGAPENGRSAPGPSTLLPEASRPDDQGPVAPADEPVQEAARAEGTGTPADAGEPAGEDAASAPVDGRDSAAGPDAAAPEMELGRQTGIETGIEPGIEGGIEPGSGQAAPALPSGQEQPAESAAPAAREEPVPTGSDRDHAPAEAGSAGPASTAEEGPGLSHAMPSAFALPPRQALREGLDEGLIDSIPAALLVHVGDRLIHANPDFLAFSGYESVEALADAGGIDHLLEQPPAGSPEEGGTMLMRRAGGEAVAVVARLRSINWRDTHALLLALSPASSAAGTVAEEAQPAETPASNVVALRDGGPAPAMEEAVVRRLGALEVEAAELRSILETATDGVVILGHDGTIRSMNGSACALFGYDESETRGEPFAMLFAHESQRAVMDYLGGLAEHGVSSVLNDGREVIGREANGGFLPLFMTMGRLTGSNGYCAVLRDITQWKRTEEELRNAKRAAETASSHKSEFLARVSHEIRTPLNAIIGFSEMMVEERFGPIGSPRYLEYAHDIGSSGKHVLDIVNDLLDISKIEAGEIDLDFAAVSLNEQLAECVSMLQPMANGQRVIIRTSLSASVPEVVADGRSIKQIALNLLSNAIRYTPSGGQIVVSTSYESSGKVVLRIRDTGIGMSRKELELAMKPFGQVGPGPRQRGEGTGLGLPLTKAMVEANRAQFDIISAPSEGTLVTITFPPQRVLAD